MSDLRPRGFPVPSHPAPKTLDLATRRQYRAACFVDGRTILSPGAESVSALFDLVAPDQARRIVRGEPIYTHLVIFEPADLTVPASRSHP